MTFEFYGWVSMTVGTCELKLSPLDNRSLVVFSRTDADELEPIVEQNFDAMHVLYIQWKARSLLLIDVPPMQRSPGGTVIDFPTHNYTEM
jgi:hypothetical protein